MPGIKANLNHGEGIMSEQKKREMLNHAKYHNIKPFGYEFL
jgi:hypothetical protein